MQVLAEAGAEVAQTVEEVFQSARTVILMLRSPAAANEVLSRGTAGFASKVRGVTIIQMATMPSAYSQVLARNIEAAGGNYVEAPVSGQRKPAQEGQLVAMVAGRPEIIERVQPLLARMCRQIIPCGAVPRAQALKLASNHFVATMLAALSESVHFARQEGVDLDLFSSLMSVGPMSSDLPRMKLPKLVDRDFEVQASLANMSDVLDMLETSARHSGAATPMLTTCATLCREAVALGLAEADVVSIIRAIEARAQHEFPKG